MTLDVLETSFIQDWKDHQTKVLKRVYPELEKDDIKKFLDKKIKKNLINVPASLHNNHSHRKINITLLEVVEWIRNVKPISAGFGVFYRNQDQQINPNAVMLQKFMSLRKEYKKELHHLKPGSFEYATADRKQLTEKINANSFYGCSGAPSSRFFNIFTAASVTLTGQSLISTAAMAFEAFLGNNVGFYDLDNCFEYVENIRKEKYKEVEDNFLPHVTASQVYQHLKGMFYEYDESYDFALFRYVLELSPKDLQKVYFKNNLYAFSKLDYIKELTIDTIQNVDDFKDPNDVPESISSKLDYLWSLYRQYVFYNYSPIGRIDRLRTRERKSVIVVDTDSNFLNLNPWVEHIMELCQTKSDLVSRDYDNLRFIAINIMCSYLTRMINEVMWKYTKDANIPEAYRSGINMKNEFLYTKLVTINKKKRYIGSIRLREGKEIYPEKLDIKGLLKSPPHQRWCV